MDSKEYVKTLVENNATFQDRIDKLERGLVVIIDNYEDKDTVLQVAEMLLREKIK